MLGYLDVLHYRFSPLYVPLFSGHQPAVQRAMFDATWLPSRRVIRHGERPRSGPRSLQGFPCQAPSLDLEAEFNPLQPFRHIV
jgi:hypothetical protein